MTLTSWLILVLFFWLVNASEQTTQEAVGVELWFFFLKSRLAIINEIINKCKKCYAINQHTSAQLVIFESSTAHNIKRLNSPSALSCFELKNGRSEGFGVEPMEMLSISWPDSSPHESDSSSWKRASRSRSPLSTPWPRRGSPSSSSGRKRFSSATIFCLKFRCCRGIKSRLESQHSKSH